ncbi:NADPH-dependent F420 reductase [Chryseobacterium sp. JV558]|uniref:NADPH-dependent F420 reductase n=1 Tax=Chryseobacterium sp. JV558 TaxID=2663236 RepID=UPI00299D3CF2|nr:NAD(P)-binding domain-containing protein [Chryseobacterium sp. JV558]MDW9380703.1 NADP oxidoreductase [Chryseobacterium sp. JV558]
MKLGIIGAGHIGQSFAGHALKAGYEVILSAQDINKVKDLALQLGKGASAGSVSDAANADIVFLSIPFSSVEQATADIDWKNKTVIDATNAVTMPDIKLIDTGGKNSTEIVQGYLKGAKIVKAFNTIPAALMRADPKVNEGERVLFYSGDDEEANKKVSEIIESFGFSGIYLGKIAEGGLLQQLIIGSLSLNNLVKYPL